MRSAFTTLAFVGALQDRYRTLLILGAIITGLWLIAALVGRLIRGRHVDVPAAMKLIDEANEVEAVFEEVATLLPSLERHARYEDALAVLLAVQRRLPANSPRRGYVEVEVTRLTNRIAG